MSNTFEITKDWLDRYITRNGGYTDSQIYAVSSNKTKGWKARAIGKMISDDAKYAFEHPVYVRKSMSMDMSDQPQLF